MTTVYSIRSKESGNIFHEFDSSSRRNVEITLDHERHPHKYEIVERDETEWKVSAPDIGHHYKKDGSLVVHFERGHVEFSPELVSYLKTIL